MKLKIFKGFNKDFLSKLDCEPLYESPIEMKFNIESIRLLTTLKCQYITCKLHTKYNCIVTLSRVDDCIGYFSIAALV